MKIIKAIFTKLMFKSILHIITRKITMKNFQKKITKTTTTAQFLPFFPFFLSMFQQKTKHKFLLPARVWTNNWMNHIKYYQTNEREIEHVRFAAWQVFNKNTKKKNTKKTFDKLSFTKVTKDI